MEPWDGPASVAFTDGTVIGAVLDRNGLRPEPLLGDRRRPGHHGLRGRRARHRPGHASCRRAGCSPGRMFLVDTAQGRIVDDEEIKADAGRRASLRASGSHAGIVHLDELPEREHIVYSHESVAPAPAGLRLHPRGAEDHHRARWPATGYEPIGSMGTDTPIAVLSDRPRLLFDYFQQLFAQVTNPPLDAIREELVTALGVDDRARGQPARARPGQLPAGRAAVPDHRQRRAGQDHPHQRRRRPGRLRGRRSSPACTAWPAAAWRCSGRSTASARQVSQAIADGARIIVLSDRNTRRGCAPDPVAAAHVGRAPPPDPGEDPHQGRPGRRGRRRPRGAPHGAAGRVRRRRHQPLPGLRVDRGHDRAGGLHGLGGIDPAQGGQELHQGGRQGRAQGDVQDGHLDGGLLHRRAGLRGHRPRRRSSSTSTSPAPCRRLGGIGLDELADGGGRPPSRRLPRPARGAGPPRRSSSAASTSGAARASIHLFNPETVFKLQHATRARRYDVFKEYTALVDDQSRRLATLRGLFELRDGDRAAGPDRRGRAGQRDRQALLDRRHVATARSRPRPTRPWPSP